MNYDNIRRAIREHGMHTLTTELLKQSSEVYPTTWNLKTAALTVTMKMAKNREAEQVMRQGVASFLKATNE
mgnify:CR=1|jgi:hypothetical protein